MTPLTVTSWVIIVGCCLTVAGLVVNIAAHTVRVPRRHFITGQDLADEFVWWCVNVGMLLIATGVFWIVKHFFLEARP